MNDIKGFIKLFDLNIPDVQHVDYYLTQLSKVERYKDIKKLYALFEEAEKQVPDLYQYRIEKSNQIVDFLENLMVQLELNYLILIQMIKIF